MGLDEFYEGPIDLDLSDLFRRDPEAMGQSFGVVQDHYAGRTPIDDVRAHYRETRDKGLRGLIAGMMGAGE